MGLCATAQAFEFTNVYIVGDSLSDAGQYGSRFTTNPGLTTPEYRAQRYAFTMRPSTQGGTDYVRWRPREDARAVSTSGNASCGAGDRTDLGERRQPGTRTRYDVVQGGTNDIIVHAGLVGAGVETGAQPQVAVGTAATDFLA